MNSVDAARKTSKRGDGAVSATPSITLLNRRLGIAPAPRMLTRYEIDLLRQSAKEVAQVAGEVLASKDKSPRGSKHA